MNKRTEAKTIATILRLKKEAQRIKDEQRAGELKLDELQERAEEELLAVLKLKAGTPYLVIPEHGNPFKARVGKVSIGRLYYLEKTRVLNQVTIQLQRMNARGEMSGLYWVRANAGATFIELDPTSYERLDRKAQPKPARKSGGKN